MAQLKRTSLSIVLIMLITFISTKLRAQARIEVLLTIQQMPKLMANAGDDVVQGSNPIVLGGNPVAQGGTPPYSYLWSPPTGLSNSQVEKPILNASQGFTNTYSVSITDSKNCLAQDEVSIEVITAIEKFRESSSFYPNPTSDYIMIESPFTIDVVKIFSPEGKIIMTKRVSTTHPQIDLRHLKDGIYTLLFESQSKVVSHKLIVSK